MTTPNPPQKARFTLRIIYFALLASTVFYLFIAFFLSQIRTTPVTDDRISELVGGIFLAISLMLVVMVSVIKKRFFGDGLPAEATAADLKKYVVSKSVLLFALSEVPAILGFVYFLLSGQFTHLLVFWAISLISFIIAKPSAELVQKIDG